MVPDYIDYPVMEQVVNSEIIWNHFGYWPDFHDAEVMKVLFETHEATGRYSITFTVDAFETTNKVTAQGHYELIKQCLVEFQLTGIEKLEFNHFTFQNVLWELWFEQQGSFIKCCMPSSTGLEAEVVAEEAIVLSLKPKGESASSAYGRRAPPTPIA